jgi:hypothetical protein
MRKNIDQKIIINSLNKLIREHNHKTNKWEWVEWYKHPSTRLYNECWTDEYQVIDTDEAKKNELLKELNETQWSINFITKYGKEEKKRIKTLLNN